MTRAAVLLLLVTACVDETNLGNVRSTVPFAPSVRWAKSFDQGGNMWALAMDSTGDVVAAGNIWGQDATVTDGNQTTTSWCNVETWITKRNASDGSERWTVRVHKEPRRELELHDMAIDPDDNIVVTGSYGGTVDFGGQSLTSGAELPWDTFVAKYSPTGSLLWVRGLSSTAHSIGLAIETDDAGNIYVSGGYTSFGGPLVLAGQAHAPAGPDDTAMTFLLALDAHGAELWGHTFDASVADLAAAKNGDLLVTGSIYHPTSVAGVQLTPAGYSDTFIARFDRDGVNVASRTLGHANSQDYGQTLVDDTGAITVRTYGPGSDATLVVLDDALDEQWTMEAPDNQVLALTGNTIVGAAIDMTAGTFDLSRIEGGDETAVSIGRLIRSSARGSGLSRGSTGASGAVAFGGEHTGTFDFGTGPIRGFNEVLIVVVDPTSEPVLTAN